MSDKQIELQEDTIAFYKRHIFRIRQISPLSERQEEEVLGLESKLATLERDLETMVSFSKKRLTPLILKCA